ncbi:MAG: hypothetical protein JXA57_19890 [Armatimonadetes bacterium]|nr:hypothetical protein [Armatimonadota bacterium]
MLSEFMRREHAPAVPAWVDAQPQDDLYISAITRAEIELGVALLPRGRRRQGLSAAAMRMFAAINGLSLVDPYSHTT